eukprot:gb/GECG01011743.1/.p1 GENE.gb/GECG01011743.1/~~gb/GECG01011743.1/.p1  ORF type:complete len:523 (+),score=72.55 gb/GECG01011743.1/:1-1569(+)
MSHSQENAEATNEEAHVPQYVQALWTFKGEEPGDLKFRSGDILKIEAAEHFGWWRACVYKTRDYRKVSPEEERGLVPCNYLTEITEHEAVHGEPLRGLKSRTRKRKEKSKPTTLSFRSSEYIRRIEVTAAERKLVCREPIEIRTLYKVEVVLKRLRVVEKRYHEFLELDSNLRGLCPQLEVDVDLRKKELMVSKKTAYTQELRRNAVNAYLQKAIQDPNAAALILTFLFPESPVTAQPSDRNLLNQDSENEATGIASSDINSSEEASNAITATGRSESTLEPPSPRNSKKYRVVIDDIEAFDDLIDKGYAILQCSGGAEPNVSPSVGDTVSVSFTVLVWDGSRESAMEVDKCNGGLFTMNISEHATVFVGDNYDTKLFVPVPRGLCAGLESVPVGASATIIVSPEVAFGLSGLPPTVPEASHLVYYIQVHSIEEKGSQDTQSSTVEQGIQKLQVAHHQGRSKKRVELERGDSRSTTPEAENTPSNYVRIGGQCVPPEQAQAILDQMLPQLQQQQGDKRERVK